MKKIILTVLSVLSFTMVSAQEIENVNTNNLKHWQVRLRGVGVVPNENSTIGTIGGEASVSNSLIPELDITYFFTENFAAELILGTSKHEVKAIGTVAGDIDLGSVYLLPPTLTAQYHFYASSDKIVKPYLGAGINYTIFYDIKSGDVANVDYDNNIGYAVQFGADLMINENFFINIDAKRMFLKTDVTVDASNIVPGLSVPAKVDLNPWLLGVGFGVRF